MENNNKIWGSFNLSLDCLSCSLTSPQALHVNTRLGYHYFRAQLHCSSWIL